MSQGPKRALIIYARRPLAGRAKTRLAAAIGAEGAAGVYARLLYDYLLQVVRGPIGVRLVLSVAAAEDVPFFAQAFPEMEVCPQIEGDLGARMWRSFDMAFSEGAERVVLTGRAIPSLDGALVDSAFRALERASVVLGPAADGGYYLIGLWAPGADLFRGIAWSSDHVLEQTRSLARGLGLEVALLRELRDLDDHDDWCAWRRGLGAGNPGRPDPRAR